MQSKDLCLRTDKIAARENAIAERENAVIANNAAFENTRALFANERTAFEAACAQLVEASDQRLSEAHAELNSLKKQSAKREKVFTKAQAGFDQRGVIFENERTAVEVACAKLVDASDQRLTAAHAEVNSLKKQSVEQEQVLTKAHAEFDKTSARFQDEHTDFKQGVKQTEASHKTRIDTLEKELKFTSTALLESKRQVQISSTRSCALEDQNACLEEKIKARTSRDEESMKAAIVQEVMNELLNAAV